MYIFVFIAAVVVWRGTGICEFISKGEFSVLVEDSEESPQAGCSGLRNSTAYSESMYISESKYSIYNASMEQHNKQVRFSPVARTVTNSSYVWCGVYLLLHAVKKKQNKQTDAYYIVFFI